MSSKQAIWNNGHCVSFHTGTLQNPDRNKLYLIDVFQNRSASWVVSCRFRQGLPRPTLLYQLSQRRYIV